MSGSSLVFDTCQLQNYLKRKEFSRMILFWQFTIVSFSILPRIFKIQILGSRGN